MSDYETTPYRHCQVGDCRQLDVLRSWVVAASATAHETPKTCSVPNGRLSRISVNQKTASSLTEGKLQCEFRRPWSTFGNLVRVRDIGEMPARVLRCARHPGLTLPMLAVVLYFQWMGRQSGGCASQSMQLLGGRCAVKGDISRTMRGNGQSPGEPAWLKACALCASLATGFRDRRLVLTRCKTQNSFGGYCRAGQSWYGVGGAQNECRQHRHDFVRRTVMSDDEKERLMASCKF